MLIYLRKQQTFMFILEAINAYNFYSPQIFKLQHHHKVGVGLMAFQQFGGVNGITFYATEIFVSAGFASGNLGTILLGSIQVPITTMGAFLMDKSGRRPLLMVSASGTCLSAFTTAMSFYLKEKGICMDWVPLLALAGILGFLGSFSIGMGAIPWVIMSEIFPIDIKGVAGSIVTLVNWFGSWAVSYAFNFLMSWSSSGLIPCFVILVGLYFIPESPRWLAKVGKDGESELALRSLRGKDADISQEAADIHEYVETLRSLPETRILELFQRTYIRSVIVGVGLMAFQQFGGVNGITFYATEIFVSAGFASGNLGTILLGSIQVPITTMGAFLMDKSGRRPLLMVSASGTCLSAFTTAMSFYLKEKGICMDWVPLLALAGILGFLGSFSIGMGAIPWVIMSEGVECCIEIGLVADIPNRHKRSSWKHSDTGELVWFMGCFVCFQFSHELEFFSNFQDN
ncbi:putative sugar transporter ERD6-like 7 [Cocos nucifera]|uniref:Putative sugar transporter ERD6-like 7 n=1 Tax=Cocos nucifera TaxID=13894 RepID=A0A8K0NAC9_COCNU|nr:putative sugar transporter ERD6-like 7 [Cocos nucifera]